MTILKDRKFSARSLMNSKMFIKSHKNNSRRFSFYWVKTIDILCIKTPYCLKIVNKYDYWLTNRGIERCKSGRPTFQEWGDRSNTNVRFYSVSTNTRVMFNEDV